MNLLKRKELRRAVLEAAKEWHADEIVAIQTELKGIEEYLSDDSHDPDCTCIRCEDK